MEPELAGRQTVDELFEDMHEQYKRWLQTAPGGAFEEEELYAIYAHGFSLLGVVIAPILDVIDNELTPVEEALNATWGEVMKVLMRRLAHDHQG
jgi:hypothetical protein